MTNFDVYHIYITRVFLYFFIIKKISICSQLLTIPTYSKNQLLITTHDKVLENEKLIHLIAFFFGS